MAQNRLVSLRPFKMFVGRRGAQLCAPTQASTLKGQSARFGASMGGVEAPVCRLLGASASRPVDLEYFLVTGPRPFKDLGGLEAPRWAPFPDKNSHPHGWGLGWYEAGMPRCRKRPEPAAQSVELRRLAAQARSKAFVCHI